MVSVDWRREVSSKVSVCLGTSVWPRDYVCLKVFVGLELFVNLAMSESLGVFVSLGVSVWL